MTNTRLIVGLGNPGEKYENTRHNIGFMVVDELAEKLTKGPVDWEESSRFNSFILLSSARNIILAKPQSFMNASGAVVAKVAQYYKVSAENIWIVHDDVDLPLGKIKIRLGGAAAGHHGVESIMANLGTDKFLRFRLGIGHPGRGADAHVEDYVLKDFDTNEKSEVKHLTKQTLQALEVSLKDGPEKAMNQFNQ